MAIIGREPPADIVVPAPMVSARHAEITYRPDGTYLLVDLGSLNGTFVNERRIQSTIVRLSDRVRLGSHVLDLRAIEHLIPRLGMGIPPPTVGASPRPPHGSQPDLSAAPPVQPSPHPPPRPAAPSPAPPGPQPGACPGCGSTDVVSLEVFRREHPEKVKVQSTGCMPGCIGCLLILLLVVILWPVLLGIGLISGVLGGLGLATVGYFVKEHLALVLVGVGIILAVSIVVRVTQPKRICRRCGKKF